MNSPHRGQDADLDVSAETDVDHPELCGQNGEVERLRRQPEHERDGVRGRELFPPLSRKVILALFSCTMFSLRILVNYTK